jgi:hypothetical protein
MYLLGFWLQISGDDSLAKFNGGGFTSVTPLAMLLLVVAILLILTLPRNRVLMPFLFFGMVIPLGSQFVVGGIHLHLLRFIVLAGLVRILASSKPDNSLIGPLHPIDKALFAFQLVSMITFLLLNPEQAAVINQMGTQYTVLGSYLVLRSLIRDADDVLLAVKVLVAIGVVAALGMIVELATGGKNFFMLLGGVRFDDGLREGRLRAQAFFAISIIAGCYGAALLPFSTWLWFHEKRLKKWAILCGVVAIVVTFASASSTPIMAFLAAIGAYFFWPVRRQMRWVRRGIVAGLIFLQIVLKNPVWHLISRIDVVGGNSADHRYQLVNQCILHFRDWWLIGTNENYKWGWDMWDTANYYVATAEGAGLLGLIFLLAILSRAFRSIGVARLAIENDRRQEWMYWSLGAVVFSHSVAFFGITYFDQTFVAWFTVLAIIVALSTPYLGLRKIAAEPLPERGRIKVTQQAVNVSLNNDARGVKRVQRLS